MHLRELGPPGIATRNSQECILAQLKVLAQHGTTHKLAIPIVQHYMDDLGHHRYHKLAHLLQCSSLEQMQKQELIKVLDAAVLVRKADGKPRIKQLHNLVGAGALGGAFWGMLIGILFLIPWIGMAVGAASGALAGAFSDVGIDDDFIKETRNKIEPGSSALFLLTQNEVIDRVGDELKDADFEIMHTNLSKDDEAKLREAFGVEAEEESA